MNYHSIDKRLFCSLKDSIGAEKKYFSINLIVKNKCSNLNLLRNTKEFIQKIVIIGMLKKIT